MMRLVTLTLIGAVLLSACRRAGDLLPEEVLRRVTLRSGQLQSVEMAGDLDAAVTMSGSRISGRATVQGVLTNGGDQAEFSVHAQGILDRGSQRSTFQWSGEIVRDAEVSFVLLRDVSVDPPSTFSQGLEAMLGTWWSLPRSENDRASLPSLTPDPRFLRAQSMVITVVKDLGLEDIGGRDAYHYVVSIDPDRLVGLMQGLAEERGQPFSIEETRRTLDRYDAQGELWIDADTFVVHRIAWTIVTREKPPATRIAFRLQLRKHDDAPGVTIPTQSQPLDPTFLLPTFSF